MITFSLITTQPRPGFRCLVMSRWPIWVLACLALCGCQTAGGPIAPVSSVDCPQPTLCDDPESDSLLQAPATGPLVIKTAWRPLFPGCPTTLQVKARLHPIAFNAVRPEVAPETGNDPSDWDCDPPEAPLLRAWRWRPEQDLAAR